MIRRAALALAALAAVACATRSTVDREPARPSPAAGPEAARPFDGTYPLEIAWPFHVGLLHWLDSLVDADGAGLTAGKTAALHRGELLQRFGQLDDGDRLALERYALVRREYVRRSRRGDVDGLTRAFLQADDLDAALRAAIPLVGERAADELGAACRRFEARYETIWWRGERSRRFAEALVAHPRRAELGDLLARLARFYGVDPALPHPPRMFVVPTPAGRGSHAQAFGRLLLLEVRPRDGLLDQIGPIVHESAHDLFARVDDERRIAWERLAAGRGREGLTAWRLLLEALPTALGQGVAERMFTPDAWDPRRPWYHRAEVDRYAKALVPIVGAALAEDRPLDGELIAEMLDLWVGS